MTLACRLPTGDAIVIRDIVTVWDVTFRRHWTLLGGIGLTVLQILDVTLQLNANSLSAVAQRGSLPIAFPSRTAPTVERKAMRKFKHYGLLSFCEEINDCRWPDKKKKNEKRGPSSAKPLLVISHRIGFA